MWTKQYFGCLSLRIILFRPWFQSSTVFLFFMLGHIGADNTKSNYHSNLPYNKWRIKKIATVYAKIFQVKLLIYQCINIEMRRLSRITKRERKRERKKKLKNIDIQFGQTSIILTINFCENFWWCFSLQFVPMNVICDLGKHIFIFLIHFW